MTRLETIDRLRQLAIRHEARGNAESAMSIRRQATLYEFMTDAQFETFKERMMAIPPIPKPNDAIRIGPMRTLRYDKGRLLPD